MSTDRIPVTIVGGFLGAGKTTLLNRLLSLAHGQRRYAVIVNDFGKLAVDASLIEHADEEMLVLSNGCVCCSLAVDLQRGLLKILEECEDLDGIFIETSGVTRIDALVEEIERTALAEHVERRRTVVVVAAARFPKLTAAIPITREQVASANVVLLNRCDLVDGAGRSEARAAIVAIRPDVPIVETERCNVGFDTLEVPQQPSANFHSEASETPERWITAQVTLPEAAETESVRSAASSLPDEVQRLKGFFRGPNGEILHVELAGGTVEITPWPGRALEGPIGVLVAIGTETLLEDLNDAFAEIDGVRVHADDATTSHDH